MFNFIKTKNKISYYVYPKDINYNHVERESTEVRIAQKWEKNEKSLTKKNEEISG